jgi:hypothetical protein
MTFDLKHTSLEAALAAASRSFVCVFGGGASRSGRRSTSGRRERLEETKNDPGREAAGKCGVTAPAFQVKR